MNTIHPVVSVIITVLNGAQTITDTLESVVAQNYKNYEIIIVNDGSTDETIRLLNSFKKKHPLIDIRIFDNPQKGRSSALNLAIAKSKGEFIANIDADDLWTYDHLERQVYNIKNGINFGLICSNYYILMGNNSNLFKGEKGKKELYINDITKKIGRTNPINHSSVIFKKDLINKYGGYNERMHKLVDFELWLRFKLNGVRFGYSPQITCMQRIHKNQHFENRGQWKYAWGAFKLAFKYLLLYKDYIGIIQAMVRFLYNLFPQVFRQRLKKRLLNK